MNDENTAALNAKHPKMFLFHNFRSASHFIFECGDGWYNIISAMLNQIEYHIGNNNDRFNRFAEAQDMINNGAEDQVYPYMLQQIEAIKNGNGEWPVELDYPVVQQIKEKFGTLRVYMNGLDNETTAIINMAEAMCHTTCEECGNIGKIRAGGWVKTLCDGDEIKRQEQIAEREAQQASYLASMVDKK